MVYSHTLSINAKCIFNDILDGLSRILVIYVVFGLGVRNLKIGFEHIQLLQKYHNIVCETYKQRLFLNIFVVVECAHTFLGSDRVVLKMYLSKSQLCQMTQKPV